MLFLGAFSISFLFVCVWGLVGFCLVGLVLGEGELVVTSFLCSTISLNEQGP